MHLKPWHWHDAGTSALMGFWMTILKFGMGFGYK